MADVEFKDYTIEVQNVMNSKILAVLEEVSGELESQVKRNSRTASSKTKNSFRHYISGSLKSGEFRANIGSSDKNAIWEEFGTGEHALPEGGGGRKGAWYVPVEGYKGKKRPTYNGKVVIVYGKNKKKYYKTNGKKPSRAFWNAFTKLKSKIIKRIQNSLKGM